MLENDFEEKTNGMPLKILIIGDTCVGKTNIMTRFANNVFKEHTLATICMNFGSRKLALEKNKLVCFHIWDTAGQEKYFSVPKKFFEGANGCFLVYDITNEISFNNLDTWFNNIKNLCKENISIILVGNKCDLESQRKITKELGISKAKKLECPFFETSAKDNINIEEIFRKMGENIYKILGDKIIIKKLKLQTNITKPKKQIKEGINLIQKGNDTDMEKYNYCYK